MELSVLKKSEPYRSRLQKTAKLSREDARLIKELARSYEKTGRFDATLISGLRPLHTDEKLKPDFERTLRGYGLPSDLFDRLGSEISAGSPLPSYQSPWHGAPHRNGEDAPLHDLSSTGIIPDDIYAKPENYSHNLDTETRKSLLLAQKGPETEIRVYRAVPKGIADINPGDWVTLSLSYAMTHNKSALDGKGEILTRRVKAKDVFWDGNDLLELGYDPR